MLLNDSEKNEVLGIDTDCTLKMTIDDSDKGVLMAILSQGFYSDGIGSLIRESISNSLDSIREAGKNTPILAKLVLENDTFVFSAEDQGVGLSPDRVQQVFSKYCASTKRESKTQLGAFGLGSKAPLSYRDSFTIISRYDGKIYTYLMLKGENGTELSLVDLDDTYLPNGVIIKVPLKEKNDYELFLQKMQQQLCFFEQVIIKTEYNELDPDFKIIKNDLWKYSELNNDKYIHLCLDDVYYSIDYKQLGISNIEIPIGLNFSLTDGIKPTPNRENIIYTPRVKELILNRIKTIGINFINQWNACIPLVNTLEEADNLRKDYAQISIYKDEEREIKIKIDKALCDFCGEKLHTVQLALFPSLSIEHLKNLAADYLQEYGRGLEMVAGIIKPLKKWETDCVFGSTLYDRKVILLKEGEVISKQQRAYLKWTQDNYLFIRKHKTIKLRRKAYSGYSSDKDTYYGLLQLYKKPKNEWRQIIKDYKKFIEITYTNSFLSIDSIEPSDEYIEWKKDQKQARKKGHYNSKEEISYGFLEPASRGKSKFNYEKITKRLCDLHKNKGIIFYCHSDVADGYGDLYMLSHNISRIVMLSERNFNKLQQYQKNYPIQNWIHVDDIWNHKLRPLSRAITNYIIDKIWIQIHDCRLATDLKYEIVSPSISTPTILKLGYRARCSQFEKYINTTYKYSDQWIEKASKIYIKNKWLEYDKFEDLKIVVRDAHKYDFVNYVSTYNTPKKISDSLIRYLFIKQNKYEKLHGIQYKTYPIEEMIRKAITPRVEVVDIIPEPIIEPESTEEEIEMMPDSFPDEEWERQINSEPYEEEISGMDEYKKFTSDDLNEPSLEADIEDSVMLVTV